MKTLFFIINKSLQGNVCGQEFLDMALMAAAFDQKVVLLFEGEGVNALVKNQCPEGVGLKNILPILNALPIYDINDVWVEKESMEVWGLVEEKLEISVKSISREVIKKQINAADHVFSF
ncbi:MAG: sulfurtransferase complex subunit TusC [Cycloclasticus sp.]|nr:sulfurtransferase complex subunit TusC [Cycloclasticus sp.]MEE4292017.1 sulfurtransferase complex subunit TusC [Cycloclasticus sp.]